MPSRLPRVNVAVTREQHALLLELAKLQGGSAAGFLRSLLDRATPLLRMAVPLLRRAAQEHEIAEAEAKQLLASLSEQLEALSTPPQLELDGITQQPAGGAKRNAASGASEARTAPPARHGKAA
jgi:hypothetical protein